MLKQKIQTDLKDALFKKDALLASVLRMTLAALHNKEIEKKTKLRKAGKTAEEVEKEGELSDEEIIETIFSEIKKRKESILEFEKGKREDLVNKEKKELEFLKTYVPEQLSEEEIKKIAKEAIEKIGAKEIKDMGKVLAELMPRVKEKAEGGLVSKTVKELLLNK